MIFSALFLLISVFCDFFLANANKVLIFNADRETFDTIPKQFYHCFTACPAASKEEREFNETTSISKNCMFLKDIIDLPQEYNGSLVECEHSYKPSILFSEMGKRFEIGYEVYFDKNVSKGTGLTSISKSRYVSTGQMKEHYKRTKKLWGFLPTSIGFKGSKSRNNKNPVNNPGTTKSTQTDSPSTPYASKSESNTEGVKGNGNKNADGVKSESEGETKQDWENILGLNWVRVFHFYFDIKRLGPTNIEYSVEVGKLNMDFECQKYTTDAALHENIDIQSLFKPDNQAKLFEKLLSFPHLPNEKCGHKYGCLKRHQVIPHYYYHSQASKITTCSAVNTLPVWESIANGMLKQIDQYLYIISQRVGSGISITTGITGILSYPTRRRINLFSRELYMDLARKKVPVPRIIYKILKYATEEDEYHIVIVIHNDPLTKEIDHVCPLDEQDEMYKKILESWKFVVNKITKSGRSYPCPMNTDVLDRLKVFRRRTDDKFFRNFSLNEFSLTKPIVGERQIIEHYIKQYFGEV